jgi:D-arabinose 1-dehydrogenase-like Zn-dependent alcohol dehydrogenase
MLAAVLRSWNEALRLEEVPTPEPGRGEVLIRVRACAPDQFDVTIAAGRVAGAKAPPLILGHEIAGDVVAVGPGVEQVGPGDRVTVFIYLICGRCRFCLVGRETLCERFGGFVGVQVDGGLAEYVIVPAENIVPIPADLDYAAACIIPGAVAAAYHAIDRRLKVRPADTVLVVGAAGGVGVHAVQLAKLAGARVIAADVSGERLAWVRALGADETVDVAAVDPVEATLELTAGRGVDKLLELVGTTESLDQSIRSLAPRETWRSWDFSPARKCEPTPFGSCWVK